MRTRFNRSCFSVMTSIIAMLLLYTPMNSWGEAPDTKSFVLDDIVVSATKTEKTLSDVPADVCVITKGEMKEKNYVNINEALETIPGVMSYTGTGIAPGPPASPVVNLRGFHGAMRTLIMVNGQPISPFLYTASLVHWSAIPVDVVERIEVVRGPFSALHGGDAVGGLINIITKTPEKFEATLRSGYGSYDTYKEHAGIGGKPLDNLSLFAAYDYKKTDNYVGDYYILKASTPNAAQAATAKPVSGAVPQPYRTGGTAYEIGNKGKYDYSEHTVTFNLKLEPNPASSLKANLLYSLYDIDPFGSASYLRDASGNEVRSGLVSFPVNGSTTYLNTGSGSFEASRAEKTTGIYTLEYINDITGAIRVKASGGLTDFSEDKILWPGSTATKDGGPGTFQEAPSRIWTGELQTDVAIAKWFLLTGGVSHRRDEGDYKKYAATNWKDFGSITTLSEAIDPESNRWGAYLQGEVTPFEKLSIYPGVRYDWWDSEATRRTSTIVEHFEAKDQDCISPKLSFLYTPWDSTAIRLSGGKAFRVPNFFELYQPLSTSGTTYLPNSNLKPEITWGWEGGIEKGFFEGKTVLSLTYFEHYTKDFIDSRTYPDPNDPTITIAQRDNFGEVEVKGIEIGLQQKITRYLKGFANYTYIDAEITDNPNYPQYVGNRPRYVPEHMANAGLDFKYRPVTANVTTHYRSRMYTSNANDTVSWDVYGVQDEIPLVTDVTIGFDFLKYYNFSFSIDNLFDSDYFLSNRAPGRTYFGMLTARF
ncbi:MAG: TonB-dependent receptor [Pseudomonadota bacterium]